MHKTLYFVLLAALLNVASGMDINTFNKYFDRDAEVSEGCKMQKQALIDGLNNKETWALRMLESMGKIALELYQGNFYNLGKYDDCLAITHELNGGVMHTKYCYPGLAIPLENISLTEIADVKSEFMVPPFLLRGIGEGGISDTTGLLVATCIPDKCLSSDVFGEFGEFGIETCQIKGESKTLDASDICCIVFLAVIGSFILVSTIYDLYLEHISGKAMHPICLAFSVYTNGKNIIRGSSHQDQIRCLNGIKVISLFWVIMGHRFATIQAFGLADYGVTDRWMRNWHAVYVLIAPLAVDTFLFVTGVLMTYGFLKLMKKPNARFNIFLYYLHRYLRITPALAVLYFVQVTIIRRIATGPLWPAIHDDLRETCLNNWWSFFLYIQNYTHTEDMCLLHSWYLSIDMQYFILSPLVLIPLFKYPKQMTYFGLPLLTVISIICPMLIFYYYDIQIWSDDYYNLFYYVSHTRFPPWFIGIAFGAFLVKHHHEKEKYQINNELLVMSIWGLVLAVIAALLFCQDDVAFNHTTLKATFYLGLQRPVWTLCLCWLVFACLNGNGGIINWFLSLPLFQVLAKTSYSTFVVHITLLFANLAHHRTLGYSQFSFEVLHDVAADILYALGLGAVWTVAFESPMITIEKIFILGEFPERVNKNVPVAKKENEKHGEIERNTMER